MRCPDDGCGLTEEKPGVSSCRRCRGRILSARAFTELHPGVRDVLRPETDRASGAFARRRPCPGCQKTMVPLRLDTLEAWLDWCDACELLWVEKLDVSVIEGLRSRRARARAVASLAEDERRQLAADLARDPVDNQREIWAIEAVERLLWALSGDNWPWVP